MLALIEGSQADFISMLPIQ